LEDAVYRKAKQELGIDVKIISCAGFYEDFYNENELGLENVHTVGIVFVVSPLNEDIILDNQSADYIWADELPRRFKLYDSSF